jgi:hypothetical protein
VRVLIVSAIFGRNEEYRRSINPTPEMTLDAALASAILRSTSDYASFVTKAQARARKIRQEYAVETMIDRHLELYQSLLQGRNSTAKRRARATEG